MSHITQVGLWVPTPSPASAIAAVPIQWSQSTQHHDFRQCHDTPYGRYHKDLEQAGLLVYFLPPYSQDL